ncbi:secretory pathway Ca2+-ATPase [Aspergillus luchuensis]|uniref:Secretory pathway Ca2+-ATPase n=1 Tax=Aspergillus kawachii TaxID=1069201 RepID=A0A146F6N3_ASPKA|nr:secretory pathway Ca2+-ATPase [Aspergillus luchuensis]
MVVQLASLLERWRAVGSSSSSSSSYLLSSKEVASASGLLFASYFCMQEAMRREVRRKVSNIDSNSFMTIEFLVLYSVLPLGFRCAGGADNLVGWTQYLPPPN